MARVWVILASVALAAGCGEVSSPLGKRAVVKGAVTLGGRPLNRGTVVFTPAAGTRADEQTRDLTAAGGFTLSVFPGRYKVSVPDNPAVAARHRSAVTTDQEVEVSSAGQDGLTIDLR